MSETQYLIWFIAQTAVVTGLLVAFVLRSMGWFERHPKGFARQLPNEPTSREAVEHNRHLLDAAAAEPRHHDVRRLLPRRHTSDHHAA